MHRKCDDELLALTAIAQPRQTLKGQAHAKNSEISTVKRQLWRLTSGFSRQPICSDTQIDDIYRKNWWARLVDYQPRDANGTSITGWVIQIQMMHRQIRRYKMTQNRHETKKAISQLHKLLMTTTNHSVLFVISLCVVVFFFFFLFSLLFDLLQNNWLQPQQLFLFVS